MTQQPWAGEGWFTRERLLTLSLAAATVLSVYLCYLLIEAFVPAIVFAVALAVATAAPYQWLRRRVTKDSLAAALAVTLVAILILAPLAILGTFAVQRGLESVEELRSSGGLTNWRATLMRQPAAGPLYSWIERHVDVEAQLQAMGEGLVSRASGYLQGTLNVATQLVITLFVLFFLYRDRKLALDSLRGLMPLSGAETGQVFSRLAGTIRATVNGSLTVALVQSILAGVIYSALSVPGAALWSSATFIAALVPVFGTALIWGPVALYLLIAESWIKAAVLIGWGVLAVGMIDNLLYPFLVGDKLRVHTVPAFFSLLGGITVFGAVGLILGPLILAVMIALLDIWRKRTSGGASAQEALEAEDAG